MPTNIYNNCTNPVSGETFKSISFDKHAFIMQWTVQPQGYVPFEHVHLTQDEIFHIEKGEVRIVIDGKEYFAKEGESITVPRGKRHIAYNNKNDVLDCKVEYRPGLDHEKFMQCFIGLTNDKFLDKKGGISVPKMGYFLTRMKAQCMTRPTEIPAPMFNVALKIFYLIGIISGWKKLYDRYTN